MSAPDPLPPEKLRRPCDPAAFEFATTDDLPDLVDIPGQARAVEAVRFGIGIRREGYNLYALGPSGTGKHHLVRHYLEAQAQQDPVPPDWCYVNNPDESHKPRLLRLPAGRGAPLRADMERLIEDLRVALPSIFESDDYRTRRQALEEEFKEWHEKTFGALQREAQEAGIALVRTPVGMALAPMKEGEVLSPDEFKKLPEEEQARLKADIARLQEKLQEAVEQIPGWEKRQREKVKEVNRELTRFAVGHLIDELRKKYADLPPVLEHLDRVQDDIVENARQFLAPEPGGEEAQTAGPAGPGGGHAAGGTAEDVFRRYRINLLIDNAGCGGAPVIYEDHPAYQNLVGRIEHIAQFGALVTDFNLIKPGALHRANGGYLILDARKVLMQPYAWEELKRILRSHEIRIESLGQALGLVSTVSLEPEPIPLDVKIVLVGDRMIYYLLCAHDPDFQELFKVAADFDDQTDRSGATVEQYAQLVATMARKEELRAFDRGAVARVIEQAARHAGDSEKLTTHLLSIADLLREADHWAGDNGNDAVSAADVEKAIAAQTRRADRVRERVHENIRRGTILIDRAGERIGQVNGLSVLTLGQFSFGQPSRITARVRLGRGEVVDIERRVDLGGPIHSKGVMILSGFLGERYAADRPLTLSASLVFEQSYGGVEGDSASMAELCALLSALAQVPIKQSLAMTGSVNQHGVSQPIGGANEKIEGFFDICAADGLTGAQGVIIPATNVKNLMLRQDVVDAAAAGKFHIYAIETVDEAIALLTGLPAGERRADGTWPEGTINARVEARIVEMAEKARRFARAGREDGNDGNGSETDDTH